MTSKKLNAVCTWILMPALLVHIVTTLAFLLTGWFDMKLFVIVPRIVGVVCIMHVCISMYIVFFKHDGANIGGYGKLNQRTIVQRASGIMILLLVHPHVKLFSSFLYENLPLPTPRKIVIFIVEMLFFGAIYTHLECSFSRSLITMGLIRSEKTEHTIDMCARTFAAVGFVVTFFALARFLISWPAA